MTAQAPDDRILARKARSLALVLCAVMVLWMGGQVLGRAVGLPERYVFLLDFAAIGAFVWCLFGIWQLWRARQSRG